MGYGVEAFCDRCGNGYEWSDSVGRTLAANIPRRYRRFRIGKNEWLCPDCVEKIKNQKKEKKDEKV